MSAWQEARDRESAKLASAITAAARKGDKRGVAALLDRADGRDAAAGIVTAAVAVADEPYRAWRESCEQWRAERLGLRQRECDRLVGEYVALLAEACGITREDIEAEQAKRRGHQGRASA